MEGVSSRLIGVVTQLLALVLALGLTHLARRRGLAENRDLSNTSMWGRTADHDDAPSFDLPSTAIVFFVSWFGLWFLFLALGEAMLT